ncbi:hypothetical protein MPTK1_7g15580 [Marchantia polymorpha subsp. ruderalis]|uniref:Uncharacterized protein n=2 Tax=Marchantia polymorpha TaxID=3197 RepID=A0AAF6C006_MARPO|nr:hypothetical protein MARPO_0009s0243 [Marchantia polymorpha]BBN17590.1 hypothetical protein Mp_7g15580 [Marchantia polymorpha subsp. ruderalis]|eukprot:PTQ47197.1 hypothetical protein MARPO_0009s0243 [Marchantia polymorpha]
MIQIDQTGLSIFLYSGTRMLNFVSTMRALSPGMAGTIRVHGVRMAAQSECVFFASKAEFDDDLCLVWTSRGHPSIHHEDPSRPIASPPAEARPVATVSPDGRLVGVSRSWPSRSSPTRIQFES